MKLEKSPYPVISFEKHFVFLTSLLIFVSFFVSAGEVLQLFRGSALTTVRVTSLLRLAREGVYSVLLMDFVFFVLLNRAKPLLTRGAVLISAVAAFLAAVAAFYSVTLDLPILVILSGLRFLEYVPLALISSVVLRACGVRSFTKIGKSILIFLIVETLIGIAETRLSTPFWGTTFIGTRSFGTFTNPNIFGAAMVFCFLFVRAALGPAWHKPALMMALFDAFASGSRAAILSLAIVLGVFAYNKLRNVWARAMLVMGCLLASPAILLLVNNSAITGRGTDVGQGGGYERLNVWSHILSKLDSAANIILGWGVGLGSNTVFTIYGYGTTLNGAYMSDNTFFFLVGSFGILGPMLLALVLALLAVRLWRDPIGLALVVSFTLQLFISQALETYPENVLAMMIVGWRLAASERQENEGKMPRIRGALDPKLA